MNNSKNKTLTLNNAECCLNTRDQPQQPNLTELTKLANNLHHLLTTASHTQTKALLHDLIHHITITAPGK